MRWRINIFPQRLPGRQRPADTSESPFCCRYERRRVRRRAAGDPHAAAAPILPLRRVLEWLFVKPTCGAVIVAIRK